MIHAVTVSLSQLSLLTLLQRCHCAVTRCLFHWTFVSTTQSDTGKLCEFKSWLQVQHLYSSQMLPQH